MRQILRLASVFFVFSLVLAVQSYAATGPEPGIAKGDHQALAMYYADQAQDFKAKARFWDNTAESYEHHPSSSALPSGCSKLQEDGRRGGSLGERTPEPDTQGSVDCTARTSGCGRDTRE